jgi:hypothetical protein
MIRTHTALVLIGLGGLVAGMGERLTGMQPTSAGNMQLVQGNGVGQGSFDWDPTPAGAPWNCYCDPSPTNFLGFELDGVAMVDGVGIRGRNWINRAPTDTNPNWIRTFRITYSEDGVVWNQYQNQEVLDTQVNGPRDPDATSLHELKPFRARFVRVTSLSSGSNWGCFRAAFYGKVVETFPAGAPLGMANNQITDNQVSALSSYWTGDLACNPRNGRLSSNTGAGSWCAQTNAPGQYIQIDLQGVTTISALATQGRNPQSQAYQGALQFVTAYQMQYSLDGISWAFHTVENQVYTFTGNYDSGSVVRHVLKVGLKARFVRFVVQAWYSHISMRVELFGDAGYKKLELGAPLGLESGKISDSYISASTNYPCAGCCDAENGRLMGSVGAGAWCAAVLDTNQFFQVDLPGVTEVTAVATQSRNPNSQVHQGARQWVSSYLVKTSMDGSTWETVSVKGSPVTFQGNSDWTTTVTQTLPEPVTCKFIRVCPVTWYSHISGRFEIYGTVKVPNTLGKPLGLESGAITDSQITTSTRHPGSQGEYDAVNGRLNTARGVGAWASGVLDTNQWFQVDFGGSVEVNGVATQGRNPDGDLVKGAVQYVTSYQLQYSPDGVEWSYYTRGDERVIFAGNHDSTTPRIQVLDPALNTRFIRIRPITWFSHISLRAEFFGVVRAKLTVGSDLGLENGALPQNAFTSSSTYGGTWAPSWGVLNGQGAWIPTTLDANQWWQVNFGREVEVGGIATQGRPHGIDQWVTRYELIYAKDEGCATWFPYMEAGVTRLFFGNSNWKTVNTNAFLAPFTARCVRVLPRQWNAHIAMRIELYKPDFSRQPLLANLGDALGVQDGKAPLLASSEHDKNCVADNGRLRGQAGAGAWCSRTVGADVNGWLQADLGAVVEVGGVATQGRHSPDNSVLQWVTSYKVFTSVDGNAFAPYTEFGIVKEFRGNLDPGTVVTHSLHAPVKARYVRLQPQGVYGHTSMRMEVYSSAREQLARRQAVEDARLARIAEDERKERENAANLARIKAETEARISAERASAQAETARRAQAELAAAEDARKLDALKATEAAAAAAAAASKANAELSAAAAAAKDKADAEAAALRASLAEAKAATEAVNAARAAVATSLKDEVAAKAAVMAEAAKLRADVKDLQEREKVHEFTRLRYEGSLKRIAALEEMVRNLRITIQRNRIAAGTASGDSAAKDEDIEKLRLEVRKWKEAAQKALEEKDKILEAAEIARKEQERAAQLAAAAALLRETTQAPKGAVVQASENLTAPDGFPIPEANAGKESGTKLVPSVTKADVEAGEIKAKAEIAKIVAK